MSYDTPLNRLYRSDGLVAGVCQGLGERLGIDPLFVRIALVISTLCGGVGVVAYLVAWAILPRKQELIVEPVVRNPEGKRLFRRTARDRKIAGVCAGLARGWDVDPSVVRFAALLLLTVSAGTLFVIYLVAALIMPVTADVLGAHA